MIPTVEDFEKTDTPSSAEPAVRLELVTEGLNFPTSIAFDDIGNAYIAEAGLAFAGNSPGGKLWRLAKDGSRALILDGLRPPVNGLTYYKGWFYISEGGHPARITRWQPGGNLQTLVENLPGPGNYHTNMAVIGPDEKLYFSQGAMTNSGIVGLDAYELGWLRRLPHAHDIPGLELELADVNIETEDPLRGEGARTVTGGFSPFGTRTQAGERVRASVPCTAALMRCNLDGTNLELVAWGLRNAYGLGFLPDGRLLAIDQGADDRGSRPIGNAPDLLYEIKKDAWYGWPDFIGGVPVTDSKYKPERGGPPNFLLANHHEMPPPERALLEFAPHAGALKFAVLPDDAAVWPGQMLVALFGDERPMTAPPGARQGRSVVRIDPANWTMHPVAANCLSRPIDIGVNPTDGTIHIVDFGDFEMAAERGVVAKGASGKLWQLRLKPSELNRTVRLDKNALPSTGRSVSFV